MHIGRHQRSCSRIPAGAVLVALVILAAGDLVSAAQSNSPPRPNVVVVFTDDQAYNTLHCAGNKAIETPNLDRLAGGGIRFDRAFVPSPVCVASRASIMSSLYPQQHGSTFLDNQPFLKKVKAGELKILPQYLAEAGYVTGYAGKTHMGDPVENLGFHEGKDFPYDAFDEKGFELAETFLREKAGKDKPFLLWISPNQPHIPLKVVDKWREFYKPENMPVAPNFGKKPAKASLINQGKPGEVTFRDGGGPQTPEEARTTTALYYGEVSHMDEQLGRIMQVLAELGVEKNTLFIFLSDNGYHLGNHGIGNKLVMYEESVRVPMIIRCPGATTGGRVCDALVSSLDVMPTILDFAGIPMPKGLEGKSLKPLLTGGEKAVREQVYAECCGISGLGLGHRMVRTAQWKYMFSDVNEEGLFNLQRDPWELNDLADDAAQKDQLQSMRKALGEWMDHVGDKHARPPK